MFHENSRFGSLMNDLSTNKKKEEKEQKEKKEEKEEKEEKEQKKEQTASAVVVEKSNHFRNGPAESNTFTQEHKHRQKDIIEKIRQREEKIKQKEEKIQEEAKKEALSMDSFPELVKSTLIIENTQNFLDILKTQQPEKKETPVIKVGWTTLKRDPTTNTTIQTYSPTPTEPVYTKTGEDLAYDVLYELVSLHEKRSAEYIENWSLDEWEKMFLFPNYDYYYFDRLDEESDFEEED
jgi:hypothetical protein